MASPASDKSPAARPSARRPSSNTPSNGPSDGNSLKAPERTRTIPAEPPADNPSEKTGASAFEAAEDSDPDDGLEVTRASIELDVLPIELVTLTDTFIESLSVKVHRTPPSIDRLSQLFQDFYAQASGHIDTHIKILASRYNRDASPAASSSSISSAASRLRNKASSLSAKDRPRNEAEQQMITPEELADRKLMRRNLEVKRHMLEEAIERRLCEGIYDRIYRHKSTQDEALDDKLRSKTAALSMVGIGPADLGVDLGGLSAASPEDRADKTDQISKRLEQARKDLVNMHASRYPLGKINHLKAAHRSIVDTIAYFHPSASADEIMPMLIFTLITLPPEHLHVISDTRFIQSFRWQPKLTGEAAYCITNLEATISFLQTVDLATLRSDELPQGPPKHQPGTPKTETFPPAYPQGPSPPTAETSNENATAEMTDPSARKAPIAAKNRRLSDLVNTPAQAFGAASDAVFATADQGLKTVSNSLGDSYKFLVGKFRESQNSQQESIAVPRTLDDARKLVSTPTEEEDATMLQAEDADALKRPSAREDRVLSIIGGTRDRSNDSAVSGRSATSSRNNKSARGTPSPSQTHTQPAGPPQNNPVLDQMRNHLTTSFNPMARLSNQIGMMRSFGRNVTPQPQAPQAANEADKPADGGDLGTAFPDIAAALPPKVAPPKIAPPNRRFMEMQNPGDLRLGEVLDLLRDYRRLAGALKNMDAFEDK